MRLFLTRPDKKCVPQITHFFTLSYSYDYDPIAQALSEDSKRSPVRYSKTYKYSQPYMKARPNMDAKYSVSCIIFTVNYLGNFPNLKIFRETKLQIFAIVPLSAHQILREINFSVNWKRQSIILMILESHNIIMTDFTKNLSFRTHCGIMGIYSQSFLTKHSWKQCFS